MSTDAARAQEIARELDRANSERRQVEMRIRVAAEAQMRELGDRPPTCSQARAGMPA